MVSEEDKKNGYTRDQLENGNVTITILKTGKKYELEEPDFDKRDMVYTVIKKLVQNINSKEIQQKKVEIAKMKGLTVEELETEMQNEELDAGFAIELEVLVRDKGINLLSDDKSYMMQVIGSAMNKPEKEWPGIEKGLKMSEGKFLYDACLAFLLEVFQDMQGDRKK